LALFATSSARKEEHLMCSSSCAGLSAVAN